MNKDDQVESGIFGISKGSRFDHKNLHWLLFDDYLSLSFSYMSFVIKRDLEYNEGLVVGNEFDLDAYNYLFNGRTSFIDSTFTREDTDEMPRVLKNFEQLNLSHLGILNYRRKARTKEELEAILTLAAENRITRAITMSFVRSIINKKDSSLLSQSQM